VITNQEQSMSQYQGHLSDGSSVQKHSAGGIYPFVPFGVDRPNGWAWSGADVPASQRVSLPHLLPDQLQELVMAQRIQDTDFFILREFEAAVAHLRGCPVSVALKQDMLAIGAPFLNRLLANGHSRFDAIDLMRAVFVPH
jgi:hypothetical protein